MGETHKEKERLVERGGMGKFAVLAIGQKRRPTREGGKTTEEKWHVVMQVADGQPEKGKAGMASGMLKRVGFFKSGRIYYKMFPPKRKGGRTEGSLCC